MGNCQSLTITRRIIALARQSLPQFLDLIGFYPRQRHFRDLLIPEDDIAMHGKEAIPATVFVSGERRELAAARTIIIVLRRLLNELPGRQCRRSTPFPVLTAKQRTAALPQA